MTNGYFQLEIRQDGTYLSVYPPVDGGAPADPSEVLSYLDGYRVDYDKIAMYNIMRDFSTRKERRINTLKVSRFDETMNADISD